MSLGQAKRESGENPEQSCCCVRAAVFHIHCESSREGKYQRYCVSQKTCLLLLHFLHDIEKGDLLHMAVHVITSPKVISRKNANQYLAEQITFPQTVTAIEEEAFFRKHQIKSVIFPETVTSIGARAFQDCIHLNQMELPKILSHSVKQFFQDAVL